MIDTACRSVTSKPETLRRANGWWLQAHGGGDEADLRGRLRGDGCLEHGELEEVHAEVHSDLRAARQLHQSPEGLNAEACNRQIRHLLHS